LHPKKRHKKSKKNVLEFFPDLPGSLALLSDQGSLIINGYQGRIRGTNSGTVKKFEKNGTRNEGM
jgi:hypothetical protein